CVSMPREHLLDGHQHRSFVERFQEDPMGPQREGGRPPVEQALVPTPAHGDDLGFHCQLFHLREDLHTVLFGHVDIGHHDIDRLILPEPHPFTAVRRIEDGMARPLQDAPQSLADQFFIVDDEDARHRCSLFFLSTLSPTSVSETLKYSTACSQALQAWMLWDWISEGFSRLA